jgi:hypothetical protein
MDEGLPVGTLIVGTVPRALLVIYVEPKHSWSDRHAGTDFYHRILCVDDDGSISFMSGYWFHENEINLLNKERRIVNA